MKNPTRLYNVIFSIGVLFFIAGNSNAITKTHNNFIIKLVASDRASIASVNIVEKDLLIKLRGKIRNKLTGRNVQIPGHVDISIIDQQGKTISSSSVRVDTIHSAAIHRKSVNSRYAKFQYELPVIPAIGSTIRIKHHNEVLKAKH